MADLDPSKADPLPTPSGAAFTTDELRADSALWEFVANDPITEMLLTGRAATVHEAEAKFLQENVDEICDRVVALAETDLTNEEFARQPLILLLRGHGSRRWEDSLL